VISFGDGRRSLEIGAGAAWLVVVPAVISPRQIDLRTITSQV
jgi:hypothetical protein